ncbi:unnamed protein product, partial [Phaeothamnion confervicola]
DTLILWNSSGALLSVISPQDAAFETASYAPDSTRFLSLSRSSTFVWLWDKNGNFIAKLQHTGPIQGAVFSYDGSRILTWSKDKTARLWTSEGTLIAVLENDEYVLAGAFSHDGAHIVTATVHTLSLWNKDGTRQESLKPHEYEVMIGAVFSPDDARILVKSYNNSASVWDLKGALVATLTHHTDEL